MLTEEELCQINLLIKREGYLNFTKNVHEFLTQQRDFYTKCCESFNIESEKKQEGVQRKTYVIRKQGVKNIEENVSINEREIPVENNTKLLTVPENNNRVVSNIINIIKSDVTENIEKTVPDEKTKKYSEEEIKKIRKGRAIQKFYKKQ